jgi:hypothetical protein
VDPMAGAMMSLSPYNYGINNPVFYNDPLGDYVEPTRMKENPGPLLNERFSDYVDKLFGGGVIPGGNTSSDGGASGITEFSIGGTEL